MTLSRLGVLSVLFLLFTSTVLSQDLTKDLIKFNEIFKGKAPFSFAIEQHVKFKEVENNQTATIKYVVSGDKIKFVSKQMEGIKTPTTTLILNHLLQQCFVMKTQKKGHNDASQMLGMEQILGVKASNFSYTLDQAHKLKTYQYYDQKSKSTYTISFDATTNFLRKYYFKNERSETGPRELTLEVSAYSTNISVKSNEFDLEQYIKEESGRQKLQSKYNNYQIIN